MKYSFNLHHPAYLSSKSDPFMPVLMGCTFSVCKYSVYMSSYLSTEIAGKLHINMNILL